MHSNWPSLGHMPAPEPITVAAGLECADWLSQVTISTPGGQVGQSRGNMHIPQGNLKMFY